MSSIGITAFLKLNSVHCWDLAPPVPDGADSYHWVRVFLLLFNSTAYIPDAQGRTFVADCMAEGNRYEERITKGLSDLFSQHGISRIGEGTG